MITGPRSPKRRAAILEVSTGLEPCADYHRWVDSGLGPDVPKLGDMTTCGNPARWIQREDALCSARERKGVSLPARFLLTGVSRAPRYVNLGALSSGAAALRQPQDGAVSKDHRYV